jgi:hypothetical protein
MSRHRGLLDHPLIGERYFFPRPDRVDRPEIIESGGIELRCYRDRAGDGAPVVLHFHGNGEVVADWAAELPAALAAAGISTLLAEYRGYGGSGGSPALGSMLDDALAIADAAGPPQRTVVYGRSVGSIYALEVASRRPVAGLVIESGIADIRQRLAIRLDASELGATDAELDAAIADQLDHRAKLEAFAGPVLILHAAGDHLVGAEHARQLAGWAGDRGELLLFDRGDHNSIWAYNGAEITRRLTTFAIWAFTREHT